MSRCSSCYVGAAALWLSFLLLLLRPPTGGLALMLSSSRPTKHHHHHRSFTTTTTKKAKTTLLPRCPPLLTAAASSAQSSSTSTAAPSSFSSSFFSSSSDFVSRSFQTECDDANIPPALNILWRSLDQLTSSGSDVRGKFVDHVRSLIFVVVWWLVGRDGTLREKWLQEKSGSMKGTSWGGGEGGCCFCTYSLSRCSFSCSIHVVFPTGSVGQFGRCRT